MTYNKFEFGGEKIDPKLFDETAFDIARQLSRAGGMNKSTQIRRFYDELLNWQQRVNGSDDEFKKYEAFIRMMNAKAAYAKGRKLVDDKFEDWFSTCIKATHNAKALDHFCLHFEAVIGFLKGLNH